MKYPRPVFRCTEDTSGYKIKPNPRLVDRWLDVTVRVAGSAPTFLFIVAGLLTWALMSIIRFGNSDVWIAAISDVQAILCYVFDSVLMRQLLREYSEQREAIAKIQSWCNSHQRMIASVKNKLGAEGIRRVSEKCNNEPLEPLDHGLRTHGLFARCIIVSAKAFGHVASGDGGHVASQGELPAGGDLYYADIIGTLVGMIFLVLVIIAWAAVGPVFHFNSNWWLLIGMYAGLVGLFDSFVLRNIQGKVHQYINRQIRIVEKADLLFVSRKIVPDPRG
ncbi:hypothetical protein MGYG_09181 [Nannizzia gypsea CBS 118893]|uniref:Uncharacterized protein n=1 Tax=Arthroderma gypseum (strain ATCC MYA-4604 / CBS 118893) TaxID=535722 RepID=E4V4L2_ARTGP|nr:hypothetical protein MGYG_09181 [Nannizzia gypsea CBS 118893]EFR04936.1 hypothetical protein MGYG_09181 [Nannizzia gypsea CBS 118893]